MQPLPPDAVTIDAVQRHQVQARKDGRRVNEITCSHGVALTILEDGSAATRGALLCTGLTGNVAPGSAAAHLASALANAGWKSLRFDYCGSLDAPDPTQLRTMRRMEEDITSVIAAAPDDVTSVLIARGRAALPALRAASTAQRVRRVILWAPVVWVEEPHSSVKSNIMRAVERDGFAMIDGTRVGPAFLHALSDPSDHELASLVRPDCAYTIVHPTGDEVHPLALAERLASVLGGSGGGVRLQQVAGTHPKATEIPHAQIDAVVAALD